MSGFASPKAVETALKIHLMRKGAMKAFVSVQQVPGKREPIYIITTESSLAPLLQEFLEERLGHRCPYDQGSFLVHGHEAERLLD
jgi:hypothetical protein